MVTKNADKKNICPRCVKGKLVTDDESGEMFCSKCGFVITEKIQESHIMIGHIICGHIEKKIFSR